MLRLRFSFLTLPNIRLNLIRSRVFSENSSGCGVWGIGLKAFQFYQILRVSTLDSISVNKYLAPKKSLVLFCPFACHWYIPDICHRRHGRRPCKIFLAGVDFYRFNAKHWQFTVYFAVIAQKIGNFLCILS